MERSYIKGDEPVPGFRLIKLLGRGGFGEVWKATAPGGAEVALKFISLEGKQGFKEFRAIRTVKNILHPNLVPIVAFWLKDPNGRIFNDGSEGDSIQWTSKASELIIEMTLGEKNLLDRLKECQAQGEPGIPTDELLNYMEEAAKAIDYLNRPTHELDSGGQGSGPVAIQHCDIKPQNIMIVGGSSQVCDFGLARVLGDARITQTSMSAPYTPPELITDTKPSGSSDQYSLAISYVELRTGALPFENPTPAGMMWAHVQGKLDLAKLPLAEQLVIKRATSLDPTKRFPTTLEMVRELRRAYEGTLSKPTSSKTPGTKLPSINETLLPGMEIVTGYKLVRPLGRGGYGTVWEATAPGGKSVALKIIRGLEGSSGRQEFKALELIKGLDHNHLLELHAYWLLDAEGTTIPDEVRNLPEAPPASTLVIASKLASKNLLQRLHECQHAGAAGIPPDELLGYMRQAGAAIDYLNDSQHPLGDHVVSIQHRDIKPENILLARDTVKVGDFGLAKVVEGQSAFVHGDSIGYTPHYAAPELFDNQVTRWTDQYALALTYFKLRTGTMPFDSTKTYYDLMMMHLEGRLDLSPLPESEREVVARATSLVPDQRFPTCLDMVSALERALSAGFPPEDMPPKPLPKTLVIPPAASSQPVLSPPPLPVSLPAAPVLTPAMAFNQPTLSPPFKPITLAEKGFPTLVAPEPVAEAEVASNGHREREQPAAAKETVGGVRTPEVSDDRDSKIPQIPENDHGTIMLPGVPAEILRRSVVEAPVPTPILTFDKAAIGAPKAPPSAPARPQPKPEKAEVPAKAKRSSQPVPEEPKPQPRQPTPAPATKKPAQSWRKTPTAVTPPSTKEGIKITSWVLLALLLAGIGGGGVLAWMKLIPNRPTQVSQVPDTGSGASTPTTTTRSTPTIPVTKPATPPITSTTPPTKPSDTKPRELSPLEVVKKEMSEGRTQFPNNPQQARVHFEKALQTIQTRHLMAEEAEARLWLARAYARPPEPQWIKVKQTLEPIKDPIYNAYKRALIVLADAGLTQGPAFQPDKFIERLLELKNLDVASILDPQEYKCVQDLGQQVFKALLDRIDVVVHGLPEQIGGLEEVFHPAKKMSDFDSYYAVLLKQRSNLAVKKVLAEVEKARNPFDRNNPFQDPFKSREEAGTAYALLDKLRNFLGNIKEEVTLDLRKDLGLAARYKPQPDDLAAARWLADFTQDDKDENLPFLWAKAQVQSETKMGRKAAFESLDAVYRLTKENPSIKDDFREDRILEPAIRKGEEVLKENSGDGYPKRLGRLYVARGDLVQKRFSRSKRQTETLNQMVEAYDRGFKLDPSPDPLLAKAQDFILLAHHPGFEKPQMKRCFDKAVEYADKASENHLNPDFAFLLKGVALEDIALFVGETREEYQEAIKAFTKAIDTDTKYKYRYYMDRGRCYYRRAIKNANKGDLGRARQDLEKAVGGEIFPKDKKVEAFYWLGKVCSTPSVLDLTRAEEAFTKAADLAEADKSFQESFVYGLTALKDWAEFARGKAESKPELLDNAIASAARLLRLGHTYHNEGFAEQGALTLVQIAVSLRDADHPDRALTVYDAGLNADASNLALLNGRNLLFLHPNFEKKFRKLKPASLQKDVERAVELANSGPPSMGWWDKADAYINGAQLYQEFAASEKDARRKEEFLQNARSTLDKTRDLSLNATYKKQVEELQKQLRP